MLVLIPQAPSTFIFRLDLGLSWNWLSGAHWLARELRVLLSISPALARQACSPMPGLLCVRVLEIKFRSPCLQGKHFSHRAMSPTPRLTRDGLEKRKVS